MTRRDLFSKGLKWLGALAALKVLPAHDGMAHGGVVPQQEPPLLGEQPTCEPGPFQRYLVESIAKSNESYIYDRTSRWVIVLDANRDQEAHSQEVADWARACGIDPSETYRVEIGAMRMRVFQYDLKAKYPDIHREPFYVPIKWPIPKSVAGKVKELVPL